MAELVRPDAADHPAAHRGTAAVRRGRDVVARLWVQRSPDQARHGPRRHRDHRRLGDGTARVRPVRRAGQRPRRRGSPTARAGPARPARGSSPVRNQPYSVERLRRRPRPRLRPHDLLTDLTLYWATQTIGSSMRLYYETAHSDTAAYGRVEVPTGMAMSGADMFPTPREWVERQYNV